MGVGRLSEGWRTSNQTHTHVQLHTHTRVWDMWMYVSQYDPTEF